MTITFSRDVEKSGYEEDYDPLLRFIEKTIADSDHKWDLRTVYTAMATLTEAYREALLSLCVDRNNFETILAGMDVVIKQKARDAIQPIFDGVEA